MSDRPTTPVGDGQPATTAPLRGRTVVVTGASSGIGAAAARQLAALGARPVLLGRDPAATARIAAEVDGTAIPVDYARLADVRRAAADVADRCPSIDLLLNNAGGMFPGPTVTEDGHELTVQVNHLAPFLLTNLLLPALRAAAGSRVVTTASVVNLAGRIDLDRLSRCGARRFSSFQAYADSKLMTILATRELARRATPDGPTAIAVHPGLILSGLGRDVRYVRALYMRPLRAAQALGLRFCTPDTGAGPLVAAAIHPDPAAVNGAYLHRYARREKLLTSPRARDTRLARDLWELSSRLVGVSSPLVPATA
jgi:NAD(P)-dependent dehydrogenase (short-subunit alcohol dehydrogenase family)